jgi:nicotinamide riboside kinase
MMGENCIYRIVITGPESTGKTELAKVLAKKQNGDWIPEYARQYVENLDRPYNYDDVVHIARYQVAQDAGLALRSGRVVLIYDTWLILTKVWLEQVFGTCPEWISEHIRSTKIDLFLICDTDLPWIADPVRENGDVRREQLFKLYCEEIRHFGFNYEIVSGLGPARAENAMIALAKHGLKLNSY